MHCVSTPFDIAQALIFDVLQSRLIATFYGVVNKKKHYRFYAAGDQDYFE
jgi:hypothetical protein